MKIYLLLAPSLLSLQTFAASNDPKNVEIENAYEDSSGRLIVQFKYNDDKDKGNPDFFGTNLTFYGTEINLFQLEQAGSGGSSDSYYMYFMDPRVKGGERNQRGAFYAGVDQNDVYKKASYHKVVCGEKEKSIDYRPVSAEKKANLQAMIREGKVPLNSLPQNVRQLVYIFKQTDGTIIYVDTSKYNYSEASYRLFVGKPGAMKEIKIKDVERLYDGGTTYIRAENGSVLFSPTAYDTLKSPTWNNGSTKSTILERVDSNGFDLASLGIKGVPSEDPDLRTPCDKFFPIKNKPSGDGGADAKPAGTAL